MDINDAIKDKSIDKLIANKFDSIGASDKNPILPYKINYRITAKDASFCGIPVVDCWALALNRCYTIFLLVKQSPNIVKAISQHYGQHESETEIEINDRLSPPISYCWEYHSLTIYLRGYRNLEKDKKYEACVMVIIGNMSYNEIVSFPSF